ncbi:MAG: DUF881 domain-containing protein [bacterium]|nr:DUF881 domain-containing protein [bacterium]
MSASGRRGARGVGARVVVALLCGIVGFAVVTQVRQEPTDSLAGLRQGELVRILDELTTRVDELSAERDTLRGELASLRSGVTSHTAAIEASEVRLQNLSIQAGVIPVHGPGLTLTIEDPDGRLSAQSFVSLLEELRNAGAEAVELNSVRLGMDTWFVDESGKVAVDNQAITDPYTVHAIGNASTMSVALEMPGGVLSAFRTAGATTSIDEREDIEIRSVRVLRALEHSTVAE